MAKCNKCEKERNIVMHAFSSFKCKECGEMIVTPNSATRTYCPECAEKLSRCEKCGKEIKKLGKVFFIEAVDCAGKTTQIDLLKERLDDTFVFYREPGGTPNAEAIRNAIFETASTASKATQALLFAAARTDLYERIIKDIENGKNVICDRSYISSMVYQGRTLAKEANSIPISMIEDCNPFFILLDIEKRTFIERKFLRDDATDALEEEVVNNFDKFKDYYWFIFNHRLLNKDRTIINANLSIEEVYKEIVETILEEVKKGE